MSSEDQGLVPQTENRPPYGQLRTGLVEDQASITLPVPRNSSIHKLTHTMFHADYESAVQAHKSLVAALADDPSLGEQILEDTKSASLDSKPEVRATAMRVAGYDLAADPVLTRGVMDILKSGARDENTDVRVQAIWAMEGVICMHPKFGEEVLSEATKALNDPATRTTAFDTLANVAYKRPDLANSIFDLAKKAALDAKSTDRFAAFGALSEVARGRADLAESVLDVTKAASTDSSPEVRWGAQIALHGVAWSHPDSALALALNATTDIDKGVRESSLYNLSLILERNKDLGEPILKAASSALSDPESSVRQSAKQLLEEIKDRRPDLAAEIGLPSGASSSSAPKYVAQVQKFGGGAPRSPFQGPTSPY